MGSIGPDAEIPQHLTVPKYSDADEPSFVGTASSELGYPRCASTIQEDGHLEPSARSAHNRHAFGADRFPQSARTR